MRPARRRLLSDDITELEIGGRGAVSSGGGFIGGGFGLSAAGTGMAIATLLNAATTKNESVTCMRLQAEDAELYLLQRGIAP